MEIGEKVWVGDLVLWFVFLFFKFIVINVWKSEFEVVWVVWLFLVGGESRGIE